MRPREEEEPAPEASGRKAAGGPLGKIDGFRLELSRKSGVDPIAARAVLLEAVARLDAEIGESTVEAA